LPRQAEGFVEVGFRSVGIGIDLEISQPAVNAAEAAEILKPLADAEGFFAEANGLIRINIGNVGSLQRKGSRVQQRCVLRAGFFRCARGGAGGILKVRKSTGSDGFRHKDGQTLELGMTGATGAAESRNLEEVVQTQWQAVGVKSDVRNADSALLFATYGAGGLLQTGKYDTGFYSWINGVDPDDSVNFMCDEIPAKGGQNQSFFCDPKLDAAERVALTQYDISKRKPAYDTIQSILADQVPTIFIWYVARQDIANVDLKGYKPAHAVTTFWNTWDWSI